MRAILHKNLVGLQSRSVLNLPVGIAMVTRTGVAGQVQELPGSRGSAAPLTPGRVEPVFYFEHVPTVREKKKKKNLDGKPCFKLFKKLF